MSIDESMPVNFVPLSVKTFAIWPPPQPISNISLFLTSPKN